MTPTPPRLPNRVLDRVLAPAVTGLTVLTVTIALAGAGLVGLTAGTARPGGTAIAAADDCGVDGGDGKVGGDCEDDGGDGGGGDHGGDGGPPENGPWTEYLSTVDCHFPEGEIDRSTTEGIDFACGDDGQKENCAADTPGGHFTWYWKRAVTFTNGMRTDVGPWQWITGRCVGPAEPGRDQIREHFEHLLPKGDPAMEPPGGRTLLGFRTNYIAKVGTTPFTRTDNVAGFDVSIRAVPTSYAWKFGDGGSLTTDQPGRPYPNLDVTHVYDKPGTFQVSVDVSWSVTYRINGGPERDLGAPVVATGGPSHPLTVLELRSLLGG